MKSTNDPRTLSTSAMVFLVIGNMIGAGLYTTSGYSLADLGDPAWVIAAWAVGGAIALSGAVAYGGLARVMTDNGGEYLYLSRSIHPAAGFIAGWVSLLAGFSGAGALAALVFESYLNAWNVPSVFTLGNAGNFSGGGWGLPAGVVASMLIVAASLPHALGVTGGSRVQSIVVGCQLVLLGVFAVAAVAYRDAWMGWQSLADPITNAAVETTAMTNAAVETTAMTNAAVDTTAVSNAAVDTTAVSNPAVGRFALTFATAVMWITLSYSGFNAAVYVAGEARGGWSGVRRAMVIGTTAVTAIYVGLNYLFLAVPPVDAAAGQQEIALIAAEALGARWVSDALTVAILVGLVTSVSSLSMAGPRVYAKMARDGLFPAMFDDDAPPPVRSIVLQSAVMIAMVWLFDVRGLISFLSMTLSLSTAVAVAALWRGGHRESIASPLTSIASIIYVSATATVITLSGYHDPASFQKTAMTLVIGAAGYLIWTRIPGRQSS